MKIPAIIGNEKNVSFWTEVELPLLRVNRLRSTSAKQDATDWGLNNTGAGDRFGKIPIANDATVNQIHAPRLLFIMSGQREITAGYDPARKQYTGESRRFAAGQFFYIYGLGGHRPSGVSTALPLTFPGLGKWLGRDTKMVGVFK